MYWVQVSGVSGQGGQRAALAGQGGPLPWHSPSLPPKAVAPRPDDAQDYLGSFWKGRGSTWESFPWAPTPPLKELTTGYQENRPLSLSAWGTEIREFTANHCGCDFWFQLAAKRIELVSLESSQLWEADLELVKLWCCHAIINFKLISPVSLKWLLKI